MIYELTDQEWEQIKKYLPKSKTGRKRRFIAKFAGILYRSALGKNKIHALVDALGYPVKILLSAGNVNDITVAPKLIAKLKLKGSIVLADNVSTKFINQIHMWSVGELTNINFSRCCFRRIATRYYKLASRFLAFVNFASMLILQR